MMFTLAQIKAAHSKVKSGQDFPAYVQEIQALGVRSYTAHVRDRHVVYIGADAFELASPPDDTLRTIAAQADRDGFQTALKLHQQGGTDYWTFLDDCARFGIAKWIVRTDERTCTYYDSADFAILVEEIPG